MKDSMKFFSRAYFNTNSADIRVESEDRNTTKEWQIDRRIYAIINVRLKYIFKYFGINEYFENLCEG